VQQHPFLRIPPYDRPRAPLIAQLEACSELNHSYMKIPGQRNMSADIARNWSHFSFLVQALPERRVCGSQNIPALIMRNQACAFSMSSDAISEKTSNSVVASTVKANPIPVLSVFTTGGKR
jgi:hypothetical protein